MGARAIGDRTVPNVLFTIAMLVLVALIVAAFVATREKADESWPGTGQSPTTRVSPADEPTADERGGDTNNRPVLLVVGDSFSGSSEESGATPWPDVVADQHDWDAVKDIAGKSGFVAGPGNSTNFVDRLPATLEAARPDLIIVAGGLRDVDEGVPAAEILDAASTEVEQLQDGYPGVPVVLLSNFSSGPPGDAQLAASEALRQVAKVADVTFIGVTRSLRSDAIDEGGVNPTTAGQQTLADTIDAGLKRAGLIDLDGSESPGE